MTRTVCLVGRWAIKVPSTRCFGQGWRGLVWSFTRGWQANLSEWSHRKDLDVVPAVWTIAGLVSVYPRASEGSGWPDTLPVGTEELEANTGTFNGRRVWVDYDTSVHDLYMRQIAQEFGLPI